jgi:hypothetical protein
MKIISHEVARKMEYNFVDSFEHHLSYKRIIHTVQAISISANRK